MKRFSAFLLTIITALGLCACGQSEEESPATRQIIAMDTAMSFTVYGENGNAVVQAAVEEVQRLEKLLSRTDPFSEIGFLNRMGGQTVQVGEEVCELIEIAGSYTAATGGAFDITIAPVVEAWGFATEKQQIPSQMELDELLTHVGMEHVQFSGDAAVVAPGTMIDLGGIAKGYAADRLAEIFLEQRVEHGWFSLGGNVLAWGARPDGEPWLVGIQDPKHPNQEMLVGMVGLKNAFAVTSGGYQRYFEQDGKTYHHILDPATGCPADNGLTSVTVVAEYGFANSGAMCDALSTALFVMGEEAALDFWRSSSEADIDMIFDFDMILVTEDDRVVVTDGIAEAFTSAERSGYTYETVS